MILCRLQIDEYKKQRRRSKRLRIMQALSVLVKSERLSDDEWVNLFNNTMKGLKDAEILDSDCSL